MLIPTLADTFLIHYEIIIFYEREKKHQTNNKNTA